MIAVRLLFQRFIFRSSIFSLPVNLIFLHKNTYVPVKKTNMKQMFGANRIKILRGNSCRKQQIISSEQWLNKFCWDFIYSKLKLFCTWSSSILKCINKNAPFQKICVWMNFSLAKWCFFTKIISNTR